MVYSFRLVFVMAYKERINPSSLLGGEGAGNITISLWGLGAGAVVGGRILCWVILPTPHIIILPPLIKFLVLIVCALGLGGGWGIALKGAGPAHKFNTYLRSFIGGI